MDRDDTPKSFTLNCRLYQSVFSGNYRNVSSLLSQAPRDNNNTFSYDDELDINNFSLLFYYMMTLSQKYNNYCLHLTLQIVLLKYRILYLEQSSRIALY